MVFYGRLLFRLILEFYASIGLPNDCVSVIRFSCSFIKGFIAASGTYKMSVRFGSNTGLEYYDCYVNSTKGNSNAAPQYNDAYINFVQQSGDWYTDLNIDVGSVNFIDVGVHVKDTATTVYPYGGYVSVSFIKLLFHQIIQQLGGHRHHRMCKVTLLIIQPSRWNRGTQLLSLSRIRYKLFLVSLRLFGISLRVSLQISITK